MIRVRTDLASRTLGRSVWRFPVPRHRDQLSRRQQTMQSLFPQRAKRVHQLGLGFTRHVAKCPGCMHQLAELQLDCPSCGAFLCTECDTMTTANGGDGRTCYGCMQRTSHG